MKKITFLEKIKTELKPDTSIIKKVDLFVKKIDELIKKSKIKAKCTKGGSLAKGTFIKGDFDVDLFIKFDYSYKKEDLSLLLEKIIKSLKAEKVHGSRDYFILDYEGINFEIVPVLDIKNYEMARNVTDASPMHVDWLKKNMKKGQSDEIRLTKKFCKSIDVYGAESYIMGFSGHLLDILIIHYGSFIELLKNAAKWKEKLIIDPDKFYKNKNEILMSINKSKTAGPMVIVDPVIPLRNAAASLDTEKFKIFIKMARKFLKNPSDDFFKTKIVDENYIRTSLTKNKKILLIKLKPLTGKRDVIGSKLLKCHTFIAKKLIDSEFKIYKSEFFWDKKNEGMSWHIIDNKELSTKKIIEGPPIDMEDHCKIFKKKYKKIEQKNEKLISEIERKIRKIEDLNEFFKKSLYIISKTESMELKILE
ncbi:CCA tRNA nucleotidyltransferase [archaeon]|jgi:tRNA nucleotidyltransferase (CCA-adding enzyme)|nr:CCA tRNA nucleotidyltransferase [archaeon]MBT4350935.1 CCA tRNA nucleotidyltransferase [archaeon]MBT4647417.1 CCA tRNA nucleotidyltransferase [archaeon]MBT6821321.1 CCA tRNA nucleotidyltransferase [archaeon]MBT7392873.1 CCA tRNA nucleotidyltransferase [archaeon]